MLKNLIATNYTQSCISLITYYKVLNFDFSPKDEELVKDFLKKFTILPLSEDIIEQSLKNRKRRKIKMADNFILSTAQTYNLQIVTKNVKDFIYFCSNLVEPF